MEGYGKVHSMRVESVYTREKLNGLQGVWSKGGGGGGGR